MRCSYLNTVVFFLLSVWCSYPMKAQVNPDTLFLVAVRILPDRVQEADSLAELLLDYVIKTPTDNDSLEAKTYFLLGTVGL
jgi:hypothetical protein